MQSRCKTCGAVGPPWQHKPSVFDPKGTGQPDHALPSADTDLDDKLEEAITGVFVTIENYGTGPEAREDIRRLCDDYLERWSVLSKGEDHE